MSLPFNIKICSLRFTETYLRTGEYQALVSIGHPDGGERANGPWPALTLSLGVWDNTPYRKEWKPLFTGNQCLDMIHFAGSIPVGVNVLVHCKRGRSRSTAASLILWASRAVPEEVAIEAMLAGNRKANPNGWMLKVADAIMDTRLFECAKSAGIVKWDHAKEPA